MTEKLFTDLCTLLDAIEMALADEDAELAHELVISRFEIMEGHGLTVEFTGPASGKVQ